MKTIIFSDTHLTAEFDLNKFNFLVKLINSADQVIINGDFWDSWFTSFDDFISSKWKKLFPLLLKKNTVYIYGNHDTQAKCDSRVKQFSVKQTAVYEMFTSNKLKIKFCHGDSLTKDKRAVPLKIYGAILDKVEASIFGKVLHQALHFWEKIAFKLLGHQRIMQSRVAKNLNKIVKDSKNKKEWLIVGDTHCSEIDKSCCFANSGAIIYGFASYITIDDGKIELHQEKY